jgi:hypothetical protein
MRSSSISIVLALVGGSLLLGVLVGWLTSLNARPFRWFAVHPWRAFWLLGVPLIFGATLMMQLVRFDPSTGRPPSSESFTVGILLISMLLLGLAGIQGLRVTWLRSRWRAVFIVLPWLAVNLLQLSGEFAMGGQSQHAFDTMWAMISMDTSWPLAAWIAHTLASRIATPSNTALEPTART